MSSYPVSSAIAEGNGYTIVENASLEGRNSFRVPARTHLLIDVKKPEALGEVLAYPLLNNAPVLVLGEGSNVLFTRDWPHVVLSMASQGIAVERDEIDACRVRVAAGENWNSFVHWSLARGFAGLENLVLIPGSVGAAPIQNIGAYGAQVGEFIHLVEAWDTLHAQWVQLDQEACRFGYRDSLFKHEPDRYLITAVQLRLPLLHELRLDYAGIREELQAMGVELPVAADVANAVIAIRRRKLPDPDVLGNAGSFFKNPIVSQAQADALLVDYPTLPVFRGDAVHNRKLSAAWMIEACGWKGHRDGDAGVSAAHALVLVNHGEATGAQLLALARKIADSVRTRFGVAIEPEPKIIGARW